MSTPADPQHITEVVESLRERLGGEPTGAAADPDASRPAGGPVPRTDAARRAALAATWHHARRAAARRDVQLFTAAAASAAVGTALLRRG